MHVQWKQNAQDFMNNEIFKNYRFYQGTIFYVCQGLQNRLVLHLFVCVILYMWLLCYYEVVTKGIVTTFNFPKLFELAKQEGCYDHLRRYFVNMKLKYKEI